MAVSKPADIPTLIERLRTGHGKDEKLDYEVHLALGWRRHESIEEASQFTPGAWFSPGTDCYLAEMVNFIPFDLRQRWEDMHREEGETPPAEYSEKDAREWWLSDEREEQYDMAYTDCPDCRANAIEALTEHLLARELH